MFVHFSGVGLRNGHPVEQQVWEREAEEAGFQIAFALPAATNIDIIAIVNREAISRVETYRPATTRFLYEDWVAMLDAETTSAVYSATAFRGFSGPLQVALRTILFARLRRREQPAAIPATQLGGNLRASPINTALATTIAAASRPVRNPPSLTTVLREAKEALDPAKLKKEDVQIILSWLQEMTDLLRPASRPADGDLDADGLVAWKGEWFGSTLSTKARIAVAELADNLKITGEPLIHQMHDHMAGFIAIVLAVGKGSTRLEYDGAPGAPFKLMIKDVQGFYQGRRHLAENPRRTPIQRGRFLDV